MPLTAASQITTLLRAWANGDPAALDRLTPKVYAELHRMARRYMRRERAVQTLQTSALVNEVFLRLVGTDSIGWQDRAHFFGFSAQIMRRILVDAARKRASLKRGGRAQREEHSAAIDFEQMPDTSSTRDRELIAVDGALEELAKMDSRKARVVELRFFGGLSVEETAEVLKLSPQSVMRDWKLAKAWLGCELGKSGFK
jgi:RNA polymerase sigma factor (TIGR02999 family)